MINQHAAAAFYGVGEAFSGMDVSMGTSGYYSKVLMHGITGGVMNVLSGGKFGHGFAAAGVTQAFAPAIGKIDKGSRFSAGRVAAAAVVGGTASSLSGGKFANGAVTGAFSRLFNDEVARHGNKSTLKAKYDKGLERVKKAVDDFGLLDLFEGKINDGTTIEFKVDNDINKAMQVSSDSPSVVYVNADTIADFNLNHIASTVGHELIHIQDVQYAIRNGVTMDAAFQAQTEVNASNWQINNSNHFDLKSYGRYMRGVKNHKLNNCKFRPSMKGC